MYALKALMTAFGSPHIDCRQDGAKIDPAAGRASYIFNPTIDGIDACDAILIVGSNPRHEAAVLNARIRERWRRGNLKVGLIGEKVDLTYPYEYLGAGSDTLSSLAAGDHGFAETLAGAKRPLVIVGQGALARPDGDAVLRLAAKLASGGERDAGWNSLAVLHTAAARVGGLDLGFVPGDDGHDVIGMVAAAAAGEIDVMFLLGADEIAVNALGETFVVYIGSHGDAGAHRADVILPAAAYTEKSAIYVNTEGRVQMSARAAFPPGEAREDWAILRALSDVLGHKLPFDSLAELRAALYRDMPHFLRVDQIEAGTVDQVSALARVAGKSLVRAVPQRHRRLLPDQSDRPRLGGDGGMLGARRRPSGKRGGVGRMGGFFNDYVVPGAIMVGQSLLLLVVLLIFVAYILYADRKIWAAVQLRRGPNVVGPWGLLQSFADLIKFVLKEPVIPSGANKGVFLLAPLVTTTLALSAWAVVPVAFGWVIADINVGILYIFAISSLGVYGIIMAGWSSNSKYPFLGALRSAAQMVSYEVSIGFVIVTVLLCVGSLNLTDIVLRAGRGPRHAARPAQQLPRLALAGPPADVRDLLHLGAGRDQPAALRSGRGGIRTGRRLHGRIFLVALHAVHARGIRGDRADVRDDHHPLPGRVAAAGQRRAVHLGPRRDLVHPQGHPGFLHVCHGEGVRSALPLRPVDATRLEGLPADFAFHGRGGCLRPATHRLGSLR